MKVCKACLNELPFEQFYRNGNMLDGYLSRCKRCIVERHGPKRNARAKEARALIQQIKVERGCADCGYNASPVALDFDHLPGSVKKYRAANLAGCSAETIAAELAKCEVVCANCHRIRTHERREYVANGR